MSLADRSSARLGLIAPLTSIRFFAAFWVALYHTMPRPGDASFAGYFIAQFIDIGYSAVTLFFVLSGFILVNVYPRLESRIAVGNFLAARVARIYPLYALALFADTPRLFLWRAAKYGPLDGLFATVATYGGSLAALQVWIPRLSGLDFPSWSVATELCFYCIFPLILARTARIATPAAAAGAALGCWLVLTFLPALVISGSPFKDALAFYAERNPLFRVAEFAIGMLVGKLFQLLSDARDEQKSRLAMALGAIGAIGLVLIAETHGVLAFRPLENAVTVPFYAALILAAALSRGAVAKIMSHPALVALGASSYALYLVHALLWDWFQQFGLTRGLAGYIGYVVAAIGGGLVLHYTVENFARRNLLAFRARLFVQTAPARSTS